MTPELPPEDAALLDLLRALEAEGYRFVTITPETHKRVIARAHGTARDLRDIFGWSLPFDPAVLPAPVWKALERSGLTERDGSLHRSRVRVSSLGGRLFLHSAFPTDSAASVFLGPDSYRFATFLQHEIPRLGAIRRLVDIGAGGGVGAIVAADLLSGARVTMTDINPLALRFARANAAHAGVEVEIVQAPGLSGVDGSMDLVIANPPFIADPAGPLYRDGGAMHGAGLTLDWAMEAAERLDPGGTFLLYSGSAIVAGRDALREELEARLFQRGGTLDYREIDPDIFGELLDEPAYRDVERIAAVGAVIRKTG